MASSIAVILRSDPVEGLRMAVGLTLGGNRVAVFVVNVMLLRNDVVDALIEALGEMQGSIRSTEDGNGLETITVDELVQGLAGYDVVIPY